MIKNCKIFDAHLHYTGKFQKKEESLIEFMDRYGIDKAIITTLNKSANSKLLMKTDKKVDDSEYIKSLSPDGQYDHSEVIRLLKNYPNRLYGFFWFNPRIATESDWILLEDTINTPYFKGVKIQTTLDNLDVSKDLDALAQFCINKEIPLYYHSGSNFFYQSPIHLKDLYTFLKKYPDLKLIIGHAAYTMEYLIGILRYFQEFVNLYYETSLSVPYGINVLIKVMGEDKVIFGSDAPAATSPDIEILKIQSLNLPERILRKVFFENIAKLIGI